MSRLTSRWTGAAIALAVLAASRAEAQQRGREKPARPAAKAGGNRTRAPFTSSVPAGRWIGQDGHDLVGPSSAIAPSDVQDIHIALAGLPPNAAITYAKVSGLGGGEWVYKGPHGPWAAQIQRAKGSPNADLYFEPGQVENGRPFQVLLQFDNGQKAEFDLAGGRADPNLRIAGAVMTAKWIGQEREDRVGIGPSVGPDGVHDARIALGKLSKTVEITGVVVKGTNGSEWHSGVNPGGFSSAELVRHGDDPSKADLYLGFDRDPNGQRLAVSVYYANGKFDHVSLTAGRCDPKNKAPRSSPPSLGTLKLVSRWLGQDGTDQVGPGDVHVALKGVPRLAIVAAALSDDSRGLWAVRQSDKVPFDAGPSPTPMALQRGADPGEIDLHFPPFRDETNGVMTLRLLFEDGRSAVATFPGGPADPGRRASAMPAPTSTVAKPGDDLNDLVRRFGTVRLSPGRYPMSKPLILEKPVRIAGDDGATLVFSQGDGDPTWTAAIKVHSGQTTLENFAVRFGSPIRWTADIQGGPAIIGATDNKDSGPGDLKAGLTFRKLDLEGPPPVGKWEEAPRLIRLGHSVCGKIVENRLKGGSIELEGGPWEIAKNAYLGTMPGTFCFAAISAHSPHDLVVAENTAEPVGPSGKTWRFLVLTECGANDLVKGNRVTHIGPRDDDTVPGDNAPEVILTEAYALHFEGRPSGVSADRRVLTVPMLQGEPARTGDVVSILTGHGAGQWRRIAQAMGPTTYLLDAPLPSTDPIVSISTGFVRETFRENVIDSRGSTVAGNLVLVGNHFGLKVVDNHLLGAGAFLISAAPTEKPVHWGWSHAPLLGATISGNVIEDSARGGTISVEHSPKIKTSKGRVYGSVVVKDNIALWSPEFAAKQKQSSGREKAPAALTFGDEGSLDPAELDVVEEGNRTNGRHALSLHVRGARLNGKETRKHIRPLTARTPATATSVKGGVRQD